MTTTQLTPEQVDKIRKGKIYTAKDPDVFELRKLYHALRLLDRLQPTEVNWKEYMALLHRYNQVCKVVNKRKGQKRNDDSRTVAAEVPGSETEAGVRPDFTSGVDPGVPA